MERTALLSKEGKFRYRLGRRWADGPTVCYVMLNPSTADHEKDDATIRRCIRFATQEGFGALEVVNLFAFRTPHPSALKYAGFPVGAENDRHIAEAAGAAERICVAWGAQPDARPRIERVMPLLSSTGLEPYCLSITASGYPSHPVRLPNVTRMLPFSLEAISAAMNRREFRPAAEDLSPPRGGPEILPGQADPAWPFPSSSNPLRPQQ